MDLPTPGGQQPGSAGALGATASICMWVSMAPARCSNWPLPGQRPRPPPGPPFRWDRIPPMARTTRCDLAVSPSSDTTIAVARGVGASAKASALALGGVAVYDGATQRPNTVGPSAVPGSTALLDTLQWSADGNTIYAANNENATGDLYVLDCVRDRRSAGRRRRSHGNLHHSQSVYSPRSRNRADLWR